MEEEFEPVRLQPFLHQVSGHRGLYQYDEETVCKPLHVREYNFYLNLPPNLRQFTAEFRGKITVEIREHSDGCLTIIGHRPMSKKSVQCENVPGTFSPKIKEIEGKRSLRLLGSGIVDIITDCETDQVFFSRDSNQEYKAERINHWSLRCHGKWLSRLLRTYRGPVVHCEFILLENLAARFRHPCILDLKMGTRQHGDDASQDKKEHFKKICQSTTSGSLGVRVCGVQVYREDTDRYVCFDKYYGRSLGVDGFKQTLHQFLHNGFELRKDLLDPIIEKLKDLHRHIQSYDSFRFYSCSLLILYDASSVAEDHRGRDKADATLADVRMIDFAHSTYRGFQNDAIVHIGPDRGFLFGLTNLIEIFTDMQ